MVRRCGNVGVDSSAAAKIEAGSSSLWTCALSRHPEYASCATAQELESDEIDRRVAAADALESSAVRAAEQYEARRERKRIQDAAYRLRKKLKRENERQLAALESFLANEDRAEADFQCVKALLLVVEGEGDDPGHVCVALVPCPARRARGDRREATNAERRRHLHRLRALAAELASPRGKKNKTSGTRGGHGASKAYRITDLWKKVTPRTARRPPGSWRRCGDTVRSRRREKHSSAIGDASGSVPSPPRTSLISSRPCVARTSHRRRAFSRSGPLPDLPVREVRVLRTPATAAVPPAPGFAFVPATDPFEDETRVFALPDAIALNQAEMSDDETGDTDAAWVHAPIARLFRRRSRPSLERKPGIRTTTRQRNPSNGRAKGGARSGRAWRERPEIECAVVFATRRWQTRRRFGRSLPRRGRRRRNARRRIPRLDFARGALVRRRAVPRVPTWTHPHWPLGGMGDAPAGRLKAARKLPRVWRGKDLDMIVFGRDERLEWARKTGMFLARARTALGDRRLHRDAWGGASWTPSWAPCSRKT